MENGRMVVDGMDKPVELLTDCKRGTVFYKKAKLPGGGYLYAFLDPVIAYEQEVANAQQSAKKGNFAADNYAAKRSEFGLVVFKSKSDLDPLTVYLAYAQRWSIELMFNMFKNIIDRDTVNVHGDYRTYSTEFINFLSAIISSRVKNEIDRTGLDKSYSFKQIFKYLAKYKKVRTCENGNWQTAINLKYVGNLVEKLGI